MAKPIDMLRDKYGIRPFTVNNEADWNELARLFVQRFQQIHGMPHDSLAGPRTFEALDSTAPLIQTLRSEAEKPK